ncbi:MFS transporter [Rudaeicoccus suwonensis]|uniref:Putative MFS family arabinose efflux permease n=1 Tax=Rudaeicoccus suwonensis TaxID=657409 RepID=A0A561E7D7_9MICO|nr:MFS transporter [Rudaeicoccus suwonensis]TWE11533.1 putative MFS family arabinose efflux permease [Rudaeicoccus suwonensis]
MSPVARYRHLFGLTGPTYVVVAFLARLPLAMSQMGALLLVAHTTGSFGAGGACAGALAVANAIGAPLFGGLSDRFGQRPVVLAQSLLSAAGLIALVVAAETHLPWAWAAVASAAAGFFMPQAGPLARVRWRPIINSRSSHAGSARLIDTAFSYEGSADEASFVLGPALVGTIGAIADPGIGLVCAAVLLGIFGSWFAIHPTAGGRPSRHTRVAGAGRLLTPALLILGVAQLIIGTVFGSVQTGTTVVAKAAGDESIAGLVQALLGVGSVAAGIGMAAVPARITYVTRWRATAGGLLVLAAPLLLVRSLETLAPTLVVLGCCVAPYMITTFTLGEQLTPPGRTGAAMTFLAATTGLGYALGAAVAGHLADIGGETPAFAVTVTAGALACLLAVTMGGRLRAAHAAVTVAPTTPTTPAAQERSASAS